MHYIILITFLALACTPSTTFDEKAHLNEIETWHKKRVERLKQPTSWLSLEGLFWLHEGKNSFGSDSSNMHPFPAGMPAFIGTYILSKGQIKVNLNKENGVLINGKALLNHIVKTDNDKKADQFTWNSYSWYIIKRGSKYGIRFKNSKSKKLLNFTGIDRFKVDPAWRIKAKLIKNKPLPIIYIPNVIGQIDTVTAPGILQFSVGDTVCTLLPQQLSDGRLSVIFADETNDEETYGAGRFLVVDSVNTKGETYIDFNKAYNPPCVFSPYATCPLPPLENRLKVAIRAGEKNWGDTH